MHERTRKESQFRAFQLAIRRIVCRDDWPISCKCRHIQWFPSNLSLWEDNSNTCIGTHWRRRCSFRLHSRRPTWRCAIRCNLWPRSPVWICIFGRMPANCEYTTAKRDAGRILCNAAHYDIIVCSICIALTGVREARNELSPELSTCKRRRADEQRVENGREYYVTRDEHRCASFSQV